jgi:hypothetical protein
MKKNFTIKTLGIVFIVLVLSFSLPGCSSAEINQSTGNDFQIAFKLDARLFGPMYGGERWVPPPYGPIAYSGTYTLEARTYYIDPDGREVGVDAEWIPEDPKLVTVSPARGNQVTITLQGLGETSLLLKTDGTSKKLYIKTTAQNELVQTVEITQ